MTAKPVLYLRTVSRLRPAQLVHRVRLRSQRAALGRLPPAVARVVAGPPQRRAALAVPGWPVDFVPIDARLPGEYPSPADNAAGRFCLLAERRDLGPEGAPIDWQPAGASQLWRYHLQYFEWAWAFAAHSDPAWARRAFARLWRSWQVGTTWGAGDAWSPYVVSLRAWAWCGVHRSLVAGSEVEADWIAGLASHARYLRAFVEHDVGGNHLVKNLKAVIGLGVFLGDDRLIEAGRRGLERQLVVQVLADGGHYERSPSYHAQVLGDLVDVGGLLAAAEAGSVAGLDGAVAAMRAWLAAMVMPDGDVPSFNDCTPAGRERIRILLGNLAPPGSDQRPLTMLQPSGYAVLRGGQRLHAVVDIGPPCPPDLPAHAHADCLSFELALDGRRVLANAGTSTYAPGAQRSYERSTAAHNTAEVDGVDQTEVWGTFRAAGLAEPTVEEAAVEGARVELTASHDGYRRLPGRPRHHRTWRIDGEGLVVTDLVTGRGPTEHTVVVRFHVAPGVGACPRADGGVDIGPLRLAVAGPSLGLNVAVRPAEVAAGFGVREPGHVVEVRVTGSLPIRIETRLVVLGGSAPTIEGW